MMPRNVTYKVFYAMVDASIQAENDLQFKVKCSRTWSKNYKATNKVAAKQE